MSDSPQPPDNACTASAAAGAGSSAGQQQQQYLHMLLESPDQGYSGVGFSEQFGKMYPADAVIGYVDAASGKPVVSAAEYHYIVIMAPLNVSPPLLPSCSAPAGALNHPHMPGALVVLQQ